MQSFPDRSRVDRERQRKRGSTAKTEALDHHADQSCRALAGSPKDGRPAVAGINISIDQKTSHAEDALIERCNRSRSKHREHSKRRPLALGESGKVDLVSGPRFIANFQVLFFQQSNEEMRRNVSRKLYPECRDIEPGMPHVEDPTLFGGNRLEKRDGELSVGIESPQRHVDRCAIRGLCKMG